MPTPGPRRWIDPKTRDYVIGTVAREHNGLPGPGSTGWSGTGSTPGTSTSGQPDPFGGTSGHLLEDDRADATEALRTGLVPYEPGTPIIVELWFKKEAAPTSFPGIRLSQTEPSEVAIDLATGAAQMIVGAAISEIEVAESPAGWWHLRFLHSGDPSATLIAPRVHPARGVTYPIATGAAVGTCTVYGAALYYQYEYPTGSPRVDPTLASSVLLALSMERGSCPLYDPEEQIGSRLHTITKATDDAVILARAYALEALRPLRARLHELEIEPSIVDVFDGSRRIGKALHVVVSWREGGRGSARRSVPYQTRIGG